MSVVFGLLSANSEGWEDFFQVPANYYQPHEEFEKLIGGAISPLPFTIRRMPRNLEAADSKQVLFLLKIDSTIGLAKFEARGFFRVYKILLADSRPRSGNRGINEDIYLSHWQDTGRIHQVPYTPALKRVCMLIRRLMGCDISEIDVFPDYTPKEISLIADHLNRMNFNEIYPLEGAIPDYGMVNNWPEILAPRV